MIRRLTPFSLPLLSIALGLVALLFSPDTASAQVELRPGVRVGANFATMRGDDVAETAERITALHAGGFLTIDPAGPFSLQPELLYTRKGLDFPASTATYTTTLDYLQVSVLGKASLPLGGPVAPFITAGPYVSLLLADRTNPDFQVQPEASGPLASSDSRYDPTDYGLVIGVGVDLATPVGRMSVSGRYDRGLARIPEADDFDDYKTDVLSISLGLTL